MSFLQSGNKVVPVPTRVSRDLVQYGRPPTVVVSNWCCSGPTSFAPAVNKTMDIVRQSDGRFHILLLIADGQVVPGQCMEDTKRAIVEASRYPLAIIMIGVGDGVCLN